MVTQNMLRTYGGSYVFSEEKKTSRFVTALDLIKCLKQVKSQRLHLPCGHISELPSDITNHDLNHLPALIDRKWYKDRGCLV